MILLAIPLGLLALWFLTTASALNSQNQAQANKDFWTQVAGWFVSPIAWTIKESVFYAKVVAKWMWPGLKFAEQKVAGYFIGLSMYDLWNGRQRHRVIHALSNVQAWADKVLRREITNESRALSRADIAHWFTTKAPTKPQRRINTHDVDVEFQRLIEANFGRELTRKYPKWEWDPSQWKKYLGILPALGGAVVTQPHQAPQPQPQPKPKPSPNPADNPTTQPTTLPHTDDHPNPDPGTQVIPGVIAGKDKWARGQIVQLKRRETSRWRHLGPLALLALTPIAIQTLIGLLECKNVQRGLKKFCGMPGHLFNDFLALLADFFILTNICTILPWLEEGFNLIEPAIAEVTAGAAAIACSNNYARPAALRVPALRLPPSPSRLPVLQLP